MAAVELAVDGMTVISSSSSIICTIVVDPTSTTKVKAENCLVHVDGDTITVSAISTSTATIPDPGPYTVALISTATKTKAEGVLVLRQNDVSETIKATPQVPGSPPTPEPVSFTCKISVAGQTKCKGA